MEGDDVHVPVLVGGAPSGQAVLVAPASPPSSSSWMEMIAMSQWGVLLLPTAVEPLQVF